MVQDHSDSEKGNPLTPHGLLFPFSSKDSFICIILQTGYHIPRPLLQEWRKQMFYLTTHSTHYLLLYGVRHMVEDHSDSNRGNPLLPHGLLFTMMVEVHSDSHRGNPLLPHGLLFTMMVEEHLDSDRGNPLPLHGLLFPVSSKGSFICIILQTG